MQETLAAQSRQNQGQVSGWLLQHEAHLEQVYAAQQAAQRQQQALVAQALADKDALLQQQHGLDAQSWRYRQATILYDVEDRHQAVRAEALEAAKAAHNRQLQAALAVQAQCLAADYHAHVQSVIADKDAILADIQQRHMLDVQSCKFRRASVLFHVEDRHQAVLAETLEAAKTTHSSQLQAALNKQAQLLEAAHQAHIQLVVTEKDAAHASDRKWHLAQVQSLRGDLAAATLAYERQTARLQSEHAAAAGDSGRALSEAGHKHAQAVRQVSAKRAHLANVENTMQRVRAAGRAATC